MIPQSIDQISDTVLSIRWDDGHDSVYFAGHLRKNCPCAVCEQERTCKEDGPFKVIKTRIDTVKFTGYKWVGRYAVGFTFSDGHKTGIFPYETLRTLCQCDQCADDVIRIQGPLR